MNGKLWPTLEVDPCPYRFRIYNGSNSRMFVLRISSPAKAAGDNANLGVGGQAVSMYQIGSDGGIFQQAVLLSGELNGLQATTDNFLVLAPGERADIIVDFSQVKFSQAAERNVFLTNHAGENSPLGNGGDDAGQTNLAHVLQFRITDKQPVKPVNKDSINPILGEIQPRKPASSISVRDVVKTRKFVIEESNALIFFLDKDRNPSDNTKPIHPSRNGWKAITIRPVPDSEVNPIAHKTGYLWAGKPPLTGIGGMPSGGPAIDASDKPFSMAGSVEKWEIYNISPDVHPMHLHLVNFQVSKRETLHPDVIQKITDNIQNEFDLESPALPIQPITSPPNGVDYNERYWKDTVRVNKYEKITLMVDFGGLHASDYVGDFVWHCHIIDHEDMGMMRPLNVR